MDTTIIRLKDNCPGFQDAKAPKRVWLTFPASHHNDGQWLGYTDLTINTGKGNPGAIGLDHVSNNVGVFCFHIACIVLVWSYSYIMHKHLSLLHRQCVFLAIGLVSVSNIRIEYPCRDVRCIYQININTTSTC